ncbi:MAG: hypothetical protein U0Z44_07455 [Kouleothrix sp.]
MPTLTVLENLLLMLELNGRTGTRARALALLRALAWPTGATPAPTSFRAASSSASRWHSALVHDPLLVLADEVTNLDAETGRRVLDLLDTLTRQAGKNLLMVTHSPEVVGLADRVFRIAEGHLVEEALPVV